MTKPSLSISFPGRPYMPNTHAPRGIVYKLHLPDFLPPDIFWFLLVQNSTKGTLVRPLFFARQARKAVMYSFDLRRILFSDPPGPLWLRNAVIRIERYTVDSIPCTDGDFHSFVPARAMGIVEPPAVWSTVRRAERDRSVCA